ncbi:Phosphatidylethanolamine N-methyltransferase [Venustampulla echinocandica]|uniref:Phosphatidylethanolamine N-methyltransferase n=1 Tax=Venustampulla echinocandica TaxID=2656787 RepID=A0A370TCJ5_9HELO|nr:Phosphatidylethanolamine N-methyltransferase [Venustampulla echinocandica]RDL31956.1 Phosphatidylethanolamine N-methyltransferase [Venustampulla echinocandica]
MSSRDNAAPGTDGLRERHVQTTREENANTSSTSSGQCTPRSEGDVEKEKKTFGRTPDGTIFTVPQTHDMVSQLLDPRQPKNLSDVIVLAILGLHILALYFLPAGLKRPVFALIFLFWRGCYNIGIGWLLHIQSNHGRLIVWAKKWRLFENPATGKNPRPWLYNLIKRELETKIPEDYKFEDAPLEYNTWLVFRRVVDLILMCDFVSYVLFAIACSERPVGEGVGQLIVRWTGGMILVGFNLWVKLDAHRVVKDYAWYWGDFFYLIDQELTFDGVFEMAPHPMYSIGYTGYYGISWMAASYNVLFISIVAHAAQFFFLQYVENPHIEKTYNRPPPRRRDPSPSDIRDENASAAHKEGMELDQLPEPASHLTASEQPLATHNLMGNLDLFRTTDLSVLLLQGYLILITLWTPSTPLFQTFFILNAIAWRIWYTVGLGVILHRQSNTKMWTRHFVKYGESTDEAWRQWKGMYHLSMTMCYASLIAATWKMYSFPADWGHGLVLLKHVMGAGLIALQVWTGTSIYESLGEFGWFFGDFFFDQAPKLTYSGIYRYLNNPERIIGLAGVWGAVCITWSGPIFLIAALSHILTLGFLQFVEKPHMQKLYGESLRSEAGLTKSIRRSLPPPLKKWKGSVDKVLGETGNFMEELLDAARPKLAAGVSTIVRDTTALFQQYPTRITITRLAPDLAGYDPSDYFITIQGTPSALSPRDRATGNEGQTAQLPRERTDKYQPLIFEYGAPIKVKWTAPVNHSKKDWVGLYMIADNESREITRVASAGRWVATVPNVYESTPADNGILVSNQLVSGTDRQDGHTEDYYQGEMIFEGDKLWWTQGVFEFRYHHDGKHNVMAISLPFEVRIGRFDEEGVEVDAQGMSRTAVESALLPVVRNCFDRDPEIAPNTVDESFGSLVERDPKYAKRVVFAVHQMFGIEFAPGVVLADGNVKKLAWRICNAKHVLAPYSMSLPKTAATSSTDKS